MTMSRFPLIKGSAYPLTRLKIKWMAAIIIASCIFDPLFLRLTSIRLDTKFLMIGLCILVVVSPRFNRRTTSPQVDSQDDQRPSGN